MNHPLVLFFLLFCSLPSVQQALYPADLGGDEQWKILKKDNYEIRFPGDWSVDTSQQMGTTFVLLSPVSDAEDQFRENVNLMVQDLSAYDLNLDQLAKSTESQISNLITDAKMVLSEREERAGEAYHHLVYTGKQGIFDLRYEQYFWLKAKKAYILTLTVEIDQVEAYQETGKLILNSFQFSDN
ncbi:MAG: hypothetical protein AAFP19_21940 [Bacteroidota bacterium]